MIVCSNSLEQLYAGGSLFCTKKRILKKNVLEKKKRIDKETIKRNELTFEICTT